MLSTVTLERLREGWRVARAQGTMLHQLRRLCYGPEKLKALGTSSNRVSHDLRPWPRSINAFLCTMLRHSFATHCAGVEVDIQEWCMRKGTSGPTTTAHDLQVATDFLVGSHQPAIDNAHPVHQ